MKRLFSILFFSLSILFFGQEEFKSMATFDFLTATMSQTPRLNVGYIQKMNKDIWLGIDVGYGNKKINYGRTFGENYQLFEIRPEIYYDLRPSKKLKHLLSFEAFYIHHTDTFRDSWFQDENKDYTYTKADYRRIKIGGNFNYNLMYNFGKHFGLMQKVGIGLRYRNVKYSNVQGIENTSSFLETLDLGSNYRRHLGNVVGVNFNLAFRFFYKF